METRKLESLIESFEWNNPTNGNKVMLGNYIGDGIMVNGNPEERREEIALLNSNGGKEIGEGGEGKVFLYEINGRNIAVKRFNPWRQNLDTNALLQFRCARKIKEMGIETPEVYAANERVLVLDHIPYPMLSEILQIVNGKERKRLKAKWNNLRDKLIISLPGEFIDMHPKWGGNGYLKPIPGDYIVGVYDQG